MDKLNSSPSFKNLKSKKIQSPQQIKEKIREDYKNKVKTCRDALLHRLRGSVLGSDLRSRLTDIYDNTFTNLTNDGFEIELPTDIEETEILKEIKNELIQNELDWWLEEYEKSNIDNDDWFSLQKEDNVICLLCQKHNFALVNHCLSCQYCNIQIKTEKSLVELRRHIDECLERHSRNCTKIMQFMAVSESNGVHIYAICEACMDMQFLI